MVLRMCNKKIFSTSLKDAIQDAKIVFIEIRTTMGEDGYADLLYVLVIASEIRHAMNHELVVVDKSTEHLGTVDKIKFAIQEVR